MKNISLLSQLLVLFVVLAISSANDVDLTVMIESRLEFDFFGGASMRIPTMTEVENVLRVTADFYTKVLTVKFPNLEYFEAIYIHHSFDDTLELPIQIDFDAVAIFGAGTDVPSKASVFHAMDTADYSGKFG